MVRTHPRLLSLIFNFTPAISMVGVFNVRYNAHYDAILSLITYFINKSAIKYTI